MNQFVAKLASLFLAPSAAGCTPAIVETVQTKYGPRMVSFRPMDNGEVMAVVTETRDGLKHSASLHSSSAALLKYFVETALKQKEVG